MMSAYSSGSLRPNASMSANDSRYRSDERATRNDSTARVLSDSTAVAALSDWERWNKAWIVVSSKYALATASTYDAPRRVRRRPDGCIADASRKAAVIVRGTTMLSSVSARTAATASVVPRKVESWLRIASAPHDGAAHGARFDGESARVALSACSDAKTAAKLFTAASVAATRLASTVASVSVDWTAVEVPATPATVVAVKREATSAPMRATTSAIAGATSDSSVRPTPAARERSTSRPRCTSRATTTSARGMMDRAAIARSTERIESRRALMIDCDSQ
mmetsp:Transcript_26777/g.82817  ORF Transcript_26777/g.82817 Transcript_26777/m.82817 type:complete len:280 (+) Transcript_26777:1462-2301(+)